MKLIVTSRDDITADYVIEKLNTIGVASFRLNTEDIGSQFSLNVTIGEGGPSFSINSTDSDRSITSDSITGAYFRKPRLPRIPDETEERRKFNEREYEEALRGLWRIVPEELWLNDPQKMLTADCKILQLKKANEIGFKIPETIVTSDPQHIQRFAQRHPELIAKAVRSGFISSTEDRVHMIFTSRLSPQDFEAIDTTSSIIPSIVQARILDSEDVRVMVIGQHVFAVVIRSRIPHESVDWRMAELDELEYEIISLPRRLEEMCLRLNKVFNLRFSCQDFLRTQQGEFVFLEINPNGEWLWLEQQLQLPICDSIIKQIDQEELKCRLMMRK